MTIGDEIDYISLYKPLHIAFHGYIAPFVVSYAVLVFLWVGVYGLWDYREVFLIAIAGVAALDFLLCLFCVWSVHLRCFVTCKKVKTGGPGPVEPLFTPRFSFLFTCRFPRFRKHSWLKWCPLQIMAPPNWSPWSRST